jgi:hypothetical protein
LAIGNLVTMPPFSMGDNTLFGDIFASGEIIWSKIGKYYTDNIAFFEAITGPTISNVNS